MSETPPGDGGRETILLAEDQVSVRDFVRIVLEQHGYRILVAHNGAEAIRVSKSYEGEIHLMIADVVMPELGGLEAARRVRKHRPDIRVLFLSGYSGRVVALGAIPSAAYLSKPFTMEGLRLKVRELLDSRDETSA